MNHGKDRPIEPRHTRESGQLISVDSHGRELRMHRDVDTGTWHANSWRRWVEPPLARKDNDERWVCSVMWGMTASQWRDCGAALIAEAEREAAAAE